jgi:Calmodulin-binding
VSIAVPKRTDTGELNYLKKEDFGKVPAYLTQVKEEIRRENDMIEKYVKEQLGEVEGPQEQYEELTESERLELISALKSKWDHTNAAYQKITHLVKLDTTGQVRRKEQLEGAMQQIESDIERLTKAGPIMVKK